MNRIDRALRLGAGVLFASLAQPLVAQIPDYPLSPLRPRGDLVAPFFDGFYRNADGTFTLSFGFLNRNTDEDVYIPLGPNNFIEPAEFDGAQPTFFPHYDRGGFAGRRERGAFAVTVPSEFVNRDVVWTLTHAGQTWSVPGRVTAAGYELSYAPAAGGSVAPALRFLEGPESTGREGVYARHQTVEVGEELSLSIWVEDRGVREGGRVPVNVTWQRHQGPGAVEFEPTRQRVDREGWAQSTSVAVFRETGEYVLRARVDNFGASDSRFEDQCCWSNGYVLVTVTP